MANNIERKDEEINNYHEELYQLHEEFKSQKNDGEQVIAKLNSQIEDKAQAIVDLESKIGELSNLKFKSKHDLQNRFEGTVQQHKAIQEENLKMSMA